MTYLDFDKLWRDLLERNDRLKISIVQDYKELEYIYNLIKGCKSYLEVGTAEAQGMYVLAHALVEDAHIVSVDYGEKHTKTAAQEVFDKFNVYSIKGNSHDESVICAARGSYDVVFIDAGHTFEDVMADIYAYANMATKYVIFHDIQLEGVKKAYDWYLKQNPTLKHHEFINSTDYGYGVIEV